MMNGLTAKRDLDDSADKSDFKSGGSARTHSRKRTRSRSRSRSPNSSPKRKERRSPKGRTRSSSPSPHKSGKPRRPRADEHGKTGRDDRLLLRKTQSDNRKSKSRSETRDSHSPLSAKETKDGTHRWRSGWEDNKHTSKSSEDTHLKPGPQRHKPYSAPSRPSTPRTPKHRLSVDANLQIPDVLNSASKKDLLRKASKRLESGEISQEDFLSVVHRIKHFFQYQEEKQQRSESWDDSADDLASNNQSPQTDPPSSKSRPREAMDPAELSYYEHKSKLRKTQVAHRVAKQEWEGEDKPEDGEREAPEEKTGSGRTPSHPPPHKYRPDERRSKEREDPRPPTGPMIEEYNHGKEFPSLKSLQGLRFIRKVDPRESSEREWNSPLTERQRDEQKSGYDAPRRYPVDARQSDPRRPEIALPHGTVVHRNCPSPGSVDQPVPRFERERLSPIHQKDSTEMSPIPRFESPNSEHSDDAPLSLDAPAPHPHLPPKSILKRGGPLSAVRQHSNSPGHTPPHEPGPPLQRFDGPDPMVPPRPHPPGWYEDGPHLQGPGRFDGGRPPLHNVLERFDGPDGPHMPHGLVRGGDGMGRFDGHPPPQGPGRFEGPMGQQPPVRFANQGPGPSHFDPQHCFENSLAPGPGPLGFQQQRPVRFDGPPNQLGPMRFEGPSRFDGPAPRFDSHFEGQQGPPRFPPQHNMQPPMRPMGQPVYDNQMVPQQNFNMGPQRFPEPMNPTFPTGPMTFPAQPSLQQGNFNMQPAAAFNQSGPVPFYNTAAPSVGMQQPVNLMGNMNQPFLPQNTAPFRPQVPQVGVPPENHFGQVDVNDLLSKLISNGIIKPSQPEAVVPVGIEPTAAAPAAAPAVEEEEEEDQEEEEEDVPDLTNFTLDELKQRHESVVTKLYSGNQCCLCSMRFTAAQTDMYADHLDWHFRQNHAGKVASKKITHRRWYYTLTDWIEFEEIADLEERAKSHFFEKENEEEVQKNQAAAKEKEFQSVRAAKDQVGELCEICQEPFETYWVEEEEDWFLKDAVRVDDKNFHPSCFEDYKNTSYVDVTPSPKKLLTDHPLSAFVKMEEEESACTSCSAPDTDSVKQEVAAETAEVPFVKEEEEVLTEVQSENTA
uniref:PCF11 cleavage and polyadenylation factor subunit n=2 Tax=Cynoglossus semilaevis TaxID=244447 RepID=A0A3P8V9I1_CYNSE